MPEVGALELEQLSPRELEIVEFAVLGLTDQQIANKLEISVSTVSSYWVRIRGKLGHMGRTEIVGRLLKQRSLLEIKRLKDLVHELEEKLAVEKARLAPTPPESLLRSVLAAGPYPMIALDREGNILFANDRFAEMLGTMHQGLIGKSFSEHVQILDVPGVKPWLESLSDMDLGTGVLRSYLGMFRSVAGTSFRVSVTAGAIPTANGRLYTCIVRPLSDELSNFRDAANDMLKQMN